LPELESTSTSTMVPISPMQVQEKTRASMLVV
jgi:hypothetical protein